jgi:hypothetical protein
MTSVSVFVSFDFPERAGWLRGVVDNTGDVMDDSVTVATTALATLRPSDVPFALPSTSCLNALCRPGVTVELFEGCVAARVSGLTDAEHAGIVRALGLDCADGATATATTEELWFMAWLKRGAAAAGVADAASCHLRLLASARATSGDIDSEQLGHVECEFIALGATDRRAGDRIAQTALGVVRDTLLTDEALVWFCGDGSVFTFTDGADPRILGPAMCAKYAAYLRTQASFEEVSGPSFVRRDHAPTGLMVFSDRRGVAARGRAIVERFLRRRDAVARADLPVLHSRAQVVELGDEATAVDSAQALLIDAAGIAAFTDAHERRLLALIAELPQLCAIALTCTAISVAALRRVEAAASTRKELRVLLVDEALFLQLQLAANDARTSSKVVPSTCNSVELADAAFKGRVDAAMAFWVQRFALPDTPEERAAFRQQSEEAEAFLVEACMRWEREPEQTA